MFTAEAVMILKNEGKIDYDVDIREYIPEFPYEGVTTRLLLNHRSGLSRYESLADAKWPDRKVPFLLSTSLTSSHSATLRRQRSTVSSFSVFDWRMPFSA